MRLGVSICNNALFYCYTYCYKTKTLFLTKKCLLYPEKKCTFVGTIFYYTKILGMKAKTELKIYRLKDTIRKQKKLIKKQAVFIEDATTQSLKKNSTIDEAKSSIEKKEMELVNLRDLYEGKLATKDSVGFTPNKISTNAEAPSWSILEPNLFDGSRESNVLLIRNIFLDKEFDARFPKAVYDIWGLNVCTVNLKDYLKLTPWTKKPLHEDYDLLFLTHDKDYLVSIIDTKSTAQ